MAEIRAKKRVKAPAYNGSLDKKYSVCAKCKTRKRIKDNFGVRYMGATRGYRPQSWCNKCRWAARSVEYEFEIVEDRVLYERAINPNTGLIKYDPREVPTLPPVEEMNKVRTFLNVAIANHYDIREVYKAAYPNDKQRRSIGTMQKRLEARKLI